MTERKITKSDCKYYRESDGNCLNFTYVGEYGPCTKLSPVIDKLNELSEENSKLQNQIDELEDDNEKYSKSLDKLEDYTKRFIPTKCLNEFKDCKTNRYYWLDHEGNLEGALELLNLMDCENEQLKQQLESIEDSFKFSCTENYIEFNKDRLKVEDTHTELTLKDGKLYISVFIPQLNEYVKFFYWVTGRKMEREFINYDGDV